MQKLDNAIGDAGGGWMLKNRGNSASIRIQAAVMAPAKLKLDRSVDVREKQGRIVTDPIRPEIFDIATLVAGITTENRHKAAEVGPAVGHETW